MPVVERLAPDGHGLRRAAALLGDGAIVALPTDTVYGVACRRDDQRALDRLFALKRRPVDRQVPVLLAALDGARELGLDVDTRAECLAQSFWPGALTVVMPRHEQNDTVGVRAPDHAVALALLRLTGPLRVTSANLSGEPDAVTADEVARAFAGSELLAAIVDGGRTPGGRPSTVVDLTRDPAVLLREGPISAADLERCIGRVEVVPADRLTVCASRSARTTRDSASRES